VGNEADVEKANQQRQRVINYLADMLTSPDCPITPQDKYRYTFVSAMYADPKELVTKLAARYDAWPVMRQEILIATVIECLNRLME
jgi:hypothetical protein